MRIAMRAALRLALTGWLGLAGLSLLALQGRAATAPEKVLPDSTFLFVKVNNAASLREGFRQSQFGQLWRDPALKDFKESFAEKLGDASKDLKEKLGVTFEQLFELPQGTAAMALVGRDDPKAPAALILTFDVGKNLDTAADVMKKATKQAEDDGAKVETLEFKGATLHVIHPVKKDKDKDKDKEADKPQPPLVWTHQASIFTIGTEVDAVKDLLAHADGRDNGLAANETYGQALKKLGPDPQVVYYVDVARFLKLIMAAGAAQKGNAAQAQQADAIFQMIGVNGLKALAGSFNLNTGNYDSLSKTVVLTPAPLQGVLKLFQLPKVAIKPEPWVPATVASYRSISWNLDAAFAGANDLVNMFQPGVLNVLEQQLAGPNGGEPISFQKDIFGPLGNRVTLISDFKKPISEDSERSLLGVALDDPKAFQNTFNKLLGLGNLQPKKREFKGVNIYEFEVPEMPNANAGNVKIKGPICVAIAKNTLFVANEPTLLEHVLRGGVSALADSGAFQAVAKEYPDKVSGLSYLRSEEQARVSYEMVKSGQFEKALQNANRGANAPDLSKLGKLIDKDKLPPFSVFAKYMSEHGGYSVQDDDGVTFTGFTLRKEKP